MGPVRGSPELRAPAYICISAPRSMLFFYHRSALQHYPPLRAPVNVHISAPRSNISFRSALQNFLQKIDAPTEFLLKNSSKTMFQTRAQFSVQRSALQPIFTSALRAPGIFASTSAPRSRHFFHSSAPRSGHFSDQRSALRPIFTSALHAPDPSWTGPESRGICLGNTHTMEWV